MYQLCVFVILSILIQYVGSSCMHLNYCNGHGQCQGNSCNCYEGYGASTDITNYRSADCSARTCPSGVSWAGLPKRDGDHTSHQLEECSGKGVCNRKTGKCVCPVGYTGTACQRMTCPNDCSGNGRCLNMAKIALSLDSYPLTNNHTVYMMQNSTSAWDSDMVHGCVCDSSWSVGYKANQTQLAEYFGADCSLRRCPSGDNPATFIDETDCYNKTQVLTNGTYNADLTGRPYNKCHIDCSNQGLCDHNTGYCTCFPGYFGPNCGYSDFASANQYSPDGIYFSLNGPTGEVEEEHVNKFNSEDVVNVFAFTNN